MLRGREQQLLAVGRALLSNPNLLLLDEPTEGIRPSIVDPIEDVIIGFKNSRRFTILLVEQELDVAVQPAEKYVVMAKLSEAVPELRGHAWVIVIIGEKGYVHVVSSLFGRS